MPSNDGIPKTTLPTKTAITNIQEENLNTICTHQGTNDKTKNDNIQLTKALMTKLKQQHIAHQGTNNKAKMTT
ncbi:15529_t:CDS:2 [Gigaspora margarita]|uniref:15529_t:CDS:1 n=1 Tax=Gigaspora margarita TaxID=4874 RepID=A0ABN7UPJ1_GIGMA|nr:15529_t:CDS:2 [Gigaspora margarita]